MKKYQILLSIMLFGIVIATISCKDQKAANAENQEEEILPEDIVELRADQIELANIELGHFELKSLGQTLKVSGVVTVAPQNFATVCMPLGGFVKNT
ncbi:MAG: hypothetical protein Q8O72_13245, partial [Bacteroidales bacterium]|nr:hypothetical protein [Bacteroidales bacterium]